MNDAKKLIRCEWQTDDSTRSFDVARILNRQTSIEGIDIHRYRCAADSLLSLDRTDGHIFSLLNGSALLTLTGAEEPLSIRSGTHLYVPAGAAASLSFVEDSAAIHVAADAQQARGEELIIHDEQFLAPARFILTPQYLSRRAFLHRDHTLVSRSGDPISWFHTTMFDTRGLPSNIDGEPVFKMSYNYQSEVNVIYEVSRAARVRFAYHPYVEASSQQWSPWFQIDSDTTYCLDESADDENVERFNDEETGDDICLRNRHEVYVEPLGHVSLCCLFDPAPTGLEVHRSGEYSDYSPVAATLHTDDYRSFLKTTAAIDEMVRSLSLAMAQYPDIKGKDLNYWDIYESQRQTSMQAESDMIRSIGAGRENIIEPWRQRA